MREGYVLAFDSPEEHYTAETFILWCFDARFSALLDEFKKRFERPDCVKWAGGAKGLADEEPDRAALLGQIRTSVRLHGTKKVALMVHAECGAYGTFDDPGDERRHHAAELEKAARAIRADPALKDMKIERYFADFHGLQLVR